MPFDFDSPVDRRGTSAAKWDKYAGRDVIPMWVADMDFRSPEPVLGALQRRVDHGVFGYSRIPDELVDVIIRRLGRLYGWTVDPEWLVWLPGVMIGVSALCQALGPPGDDVVTTTPIYPPFLTAPRHADGNVVTVPLNGGPTGWTLDPDRLEAAITPRSRALLWCSPHNPTGRSFSRDELSRVADICLRRDLVICSDEIHCELVLDADKPHIPAATLSPDIAARTVTLMSPSKTFNIAGLGFAFAVIPDADLRSRVRHVMKGLTPHPDLLAATAALAAYRDGGPWHDALLDYLRGNRDLVEQAVAELPALAMAHVEATYLAWIDVRQLRLDNPEPFFESHGLGIMPGKPFAGPGYIRLNFACPRPLLTEALARFRRAVESRLAEIS